MSPGMNWERAAKRDQTRRPQPTPRRPPTARQLAYLKQLQRRAQTDYPVPETASDASILIAHLKAKDTA